MSRCKTLNPDLGTLLQRFFVEYLMNQRRASTQTIAAYRDTFRLLLGFAERRLRKKPAALTLEDLTVPLILAFLDHLESERMNCVRTRNARFAAIRAFLHHVGSREPAMVALTQPILAIPMKRFDRPLVGFLDRDHVAALLNAPDANTWSGRRDRVMFATLYNTGARVSELTGMRVADLTLTSTAAIQIRGKGRKERCVPLWNSTATQLRNWLRRRSPDVDQPLFPNKTGGVLTRTSVSDRLKLAVKAITPRYPELASRRISPHLVRHYLASRTM